MPGLQFCWASKGALPLYFRFDFLSSPQSFLSKTPSRSLSSSSLYSDCHSLKEITNTLFTMHFSCAFVASALLTLASGAVIGKRALSGEATFYGGNVAGGACSFSTYSLPSSIFGTALSDSNWDDAAECGACVSVTGPDGNSITAMVFFLSLDRLISS